MSSAASSEREAAARLMDGIYRRQRHIYDATRKFYLLGRDRLIDELAPPEGGSVLEIGSGTGRNLIRAARRYPKARFFGLDISAEMLATARTNVTAAGLDSRIALRRGDATAFDAATLFGRRHFDRVFFSYSLSMIPDWRRALAGALGSLDPTGRLVVVDFGAQQDLPAVFRRLLIAWLKRFHVTPREELADLMAKLATAERRATSGGSLFRGYAWLGEIGPVSAAADRPPAGQKGSRTTSAP